MWIILFYLSILILVNYMYYIKCFFIYSIFGFLFETFLSFIRKTKFSSGILYGPWTPIYGIGVNIILLLSKVIFKNLYWAKWREALVVFFLVMIILTLIEWLGGVLIEAVFHVTFWNYKEFNYHIGKYICLEVTLVWGILSLILIYLIHPFINGFILLIPNIIICILIVLMIIDYIFTFVKYKKRKN